MALYKTRLAATLFADVLKEAQETKQAENRKAVSEIENGEKEEMKVDGRKEKNRQTGGILRN